MTLKEMKIKTFSLIEEYYPELDGMAEDEDVLNKINGVINQIQMELMRYRKINASTTITVNKTDSRVINLKDRIDDLYQLKSIIIDNNEDYDMPNEDTLVIPDDYEGVITIYYYKYPTLVDVAFEDSTAATITQDRAAEDEDYEFELEKDALEAMPYGVAADLLKMDMISSYGRYFYERYQELKNALINSRSSSGMIKITGGYEL